LNLYLAFRNWHHNTLLGKRGAVAHLITWQVTVEMVCVCVCVRVCVYTQVFD